VCAAEPVADIAALQPVDRLELPKDCEAYEAFAEATEGVPLFTRTLRVESAMPVQVLWHQGKWISGRLTRHGLRRDPPKGTLCLEADDKMEGGISGGPVIEQNGLLVGLVSKVGMRRIDKGYCGSIPVPWLALPKWIGSIISRPGRIGSGM
jgi:hypothetical protein